VTYLLALVSAVVTGGLSATAARMMGIEHSGLLVAIGVIGGGAQLICLMAWYLFHTRPNAAQGQRVDITPERDAGPD
jgi:hypothetical protein